MLPYPLSSFRPLPPLGGAGAGAWAGAGGRVAGGRKDGHVKIDDEQQEEQQEAAAAGEGRVGVFILRRSAGFAHSFLALLRAEPGNAPSRCVFVCVLHCSCALIVNWVDCVSCVCMYVCVREWIVCCMLCILYVCMLYVRSACTTLLIQLPPPSHT